MKTTRKIFAILLAMVLTLALCVPALAATTTSQITVDDDASTSYAGYLLMTSTDDGDGHFSYVVNPTYEAAIKSALSLATTATNADIVTALAALDAAGTRSFADAMVAAVGATGDATFTGGTAADVTQGYWLIVEKTAVSGQQDAARSLAILDTAGSEEITVTPKKPLPEVTKTADKTTADVGEEVEFTLTGTTANYADTYDTYEYEFVDTMTAMDYVADSAVLSFQNGAGVAQSDFTITYDENTHKLTIHADDLAGKITKDTVITVTYRATINDNAITTVAKNEVVVKYSNDPYDDGTGSTGSTPPEEVKVDVINLVIDKYAEGDTSTKLEHAKFTLTNAAGKYYSWDATAKKVVWSDDEVVFETNASGAISFNGLAVGTYTLTETEAPEGYNKLANPITVAVTANDHEFSDTSNNAVFASNTGTVGVANSTGTELPSTGGIGTTLFITFGMLAVLIAGVFLVTNKRISKESF